MHITIWARILHYRVLLILLILFIIIFLPIVGKDLLKLLLYA